MKGKKIFAAIIYAFFIAALIACAKPAPAPAPAPAPPPEPIVIEALSFLLINETVVQGLGRYAERVNERAEGELIIDWLGGPEVIDGWDQYEAVRTGVIDMALISADSFKARLVEGSTALYLAEISPMELRKRGFHDWYNQLHAEKNTNLRYVGAFSTGHFFYVGTNILHERPQELAGYKVATFPDWHPAFLALGMVPVIVYGPEVYVGLDRGLFESWSASPYGAVEDGLYDKTKYLIDHPWYTEAMSIVLVMNLDKWNSLPKHLQDLMNEVAAELEPEMREWLRAKDIEGMQFLLDSGMELIEYSAEDAQWYLDKFYIEGGWEVVKAKNSPESYAKLREFLMK